MTDLATANEIIASAAGSLSMNPAGLPWYVVPKTSGHETPRRDCDVVNRYGEQVAEFQDIGEAELCVRRVNGGDDE